MPRRPTTTERGYGAAHQAERRRWKRIVEAGRASCAEVRCLEEIDGRGRAIQAGTEWHLCHDPTASHYIGVGHARCNVSEAQLRKQGRAPLPPGPDVNTWWA